MVPARQGCDVTIAVPDFDDIAPAQSSCGVDRGEPDLTGNLGTNPLPASIQIALVTPADTPRVSDALASIPLAASISRIVDGRALAENLVAVTTGLRIASLIVLLGFALAVLAVVVNAIRLAILSRSDEIAIMRLVGASTTWVRLPFIFEGIAIGLVGALTTLFLFGILSAGSVSSDAAFAGSGTLTPERARPRTVIGACPSVVSRSAPNARSGAATRSIGRRRRLSSPVSRKVPRAGARRPARRRIVVPAFPQSIAVSGAAMAPRPLPSSTSEDGRG